MLKVISRDEYLDFRQAWKQNYMNVAQQIRALKVAERLASKAGYSARMAASNLEIAIVKKRNNLRISASKLQSMRAKGSNFARDMMDELEEMKECSRLSVKFLRMVADENTASGMIVDALVTGAF